MALSLEQEEKDKSKGAVKDTCIHDEDEDIEMAKALSLSEVAILDIDPE